MLTAIEQVEDNLSGIRILSREVKVQAEDVRISRQATQITLNEYKAGTQAFTAVVTAEAQQLSAEESLISTQGQFQSDAVSLDRRARRRLEPGEAARRPGRDVEYSAPLSAAIPKAGLTGRLAGSEKRLGLGLGRAVNQ